MDNKITLLGIIHFKKIKNVKSNEFRIKYLTSNNRVMIRSIKATANNEVISNITNGMLVILSGQILYSESKDKFIVRVDNCLPVKDRSGLAEDTILIQYGNNYNGIYLSEDRNNSDDVDFIQTHPRPIPGEIEYNGLLKKKTLAGLDLWVTTKYQLEGDYEE